MKAQKAKMKGNDARAIQARARSQSCALQAVELALE